MGLTSDEIAALPTDEDRRLLRDSIRGHLGQAWTFPATGGTAGMALEVRGVWKELALQGLCALCAEPSEGGVRELLLVMQEMGRAACPAPLLDSALANLLFAGEEPRSATVRQLRAEIHAGEAFACFSFGRLDGDRSTGAIAGSSDAADDAREGTEPDAPLSGEVGFVEGAQAASHLLIMIDERTLAIVRADAPGVAVSPTRAMGTDGLCRVRLVEARGSVVTVDPAQVADLLLVSRLAHAARAFGAADRAFELAVQYAKDRRQFGQPIGRFQAIQHKLADNLIALRAVRLSLENAAAHHDLGIDQWRSFAVAAVALANRLLRKVSLETHHAFGAIGYAEDHEAPRHFKRVHLDVTRHGGSRPAREAVAHRYLGEAPAAFPELDLGEAANGLRREVRAWLAEHWPPARRAAYEESERAHRDYDPDFARELGQTGWLGLTWPKRFGGLERSPYEQMAFLEEMYRADAPRAGAPIQAAAWMSFGRPEQQSRYLPELLRGEVIYGMWYSEPDAGSDLASIRTTARREGDEWVINGQKIWTTTYWGDYMWLAARTDPAASRPHGGISMFVVRPDTPGITRVPTRTMYDGEFCNTFFDNVRVQAEALVGEVNQGWEILVGSLGTERAFVGAAIIMKVALQLEELCDYIRSVEVEGRPLRLDPLVRDTIGGLAAEIEAGRQLALDCVRILARGEMPTWEAAVTKVYAGELMERFNEAALDILGMEAALSAGAAGAPMRGRLEQKLRHSLMWVISIGSNEIQRSLIAQRGLGLPR
jgi:alkylation response protein AidB-like acyl-CoA dehydrogenase